MVLRLLVPYDGSDPAHAALEYAFDQFPTAEIIVLTVIDITEFGYGPDAPDELPTQANSAPLNARAEDRLNSASEAAEESNTTVQTATEIGPPARVIVDYADSSDIDHIIMGSHGRTGLSRVLLGSVAETVVRRSTTPVTIIR